MANSYSKKVTLTYDDILNTPIINPFETMIKQLVNSYEQSINQIIWAINEEPETFREPSSDWKELGF